MYRGAAQRVLVVASQPPGLTFPVASGEHRGAGVEVVYHVDKERFEGAGAFWGTVLDLPLMREQYVGDL